LLPLLLAEVSEAVQGVWTEVGSKSTWARH